MATLPAQPGLIVSRRERILTRSHLGYGTPLAEVKAEIVRYCRR